MQINSQQQQILKQLPGVDRLLNLSRNDDVLRMIPKTVLLRSIRETLDAWRRRILDPASRIAPPHHHLGEKELLAQVAQRAAALQANKLQRTINATGVVVHTNLGRSCLAAEAVDHMIATARSYSNLEFNLNTGKRGSRYTIVEDLLCEISGAQSAMAVNNNAGAVLLSLDTLARGKEVIISRGELVEIGGSFRIPDVMAKSGALLKEVGTTNRTHRRDYEGAVGDQTGLLLKVHTSNYSIIGFTAAVSLAELVELGGRFNLPVMEDLGSGNFIDFSRYGLPSEPTVQESVAAGVDVVTFSGDKLLGGPQAGIIVGKKEILDRIKTNPLTRALRIDKMTLAALEATLQLYRDESRALDRIPTLRMLSTPLSELEGRAGLLSQALSVFNAQGLTTSLHYLSSRAGGGSLPMRPLPSCCVGVSIAGLSPNAIETSLRNQRPAVIGRIENDLFMLDPRTLLEDEIDLVATAFKLLIETTPKEKR
jgi:L-seryl-tRNA(Ser) seleniumtransferase